MGTIRDLSQYNLVVLRDKILKDNGYTRLPEKTNAVVREYVNDSYICEITSPNKSLIVQNIGYPGEPWREVVRSALTTYIKAADIPR